MKGTQLYFIKIVTHTHDDVDDHYTLPSKTGLKKVVITQKKVYMNLEKHLHYKYFLEHQLIQKGKKIRNKTK